jgi:biopolymer transport protein ExbD
MLRVEPKREELLINVTPMIDVMIFLIIFFLAATNFAQIEREQDIQLPGTKTTTGSLSKTLDSKVTINIKKDGSFFVKGERLEVDGLKALIARHRTALGDGMKVEIRADERATHGSVAKVLALVREAGVTRPAIDTAQTQMEP